MPMTSPTPWLRNLMLSPALLAALAAAAAVPPPVPVPTPGPVPPNNGPNQVQQLNSGAIMSNTQTCNPANQVGDLGDNSISRRFDDLRQQQYGLPSLRVTDQLTKVAHDHSLDMIAKNYVGIIAPGPPARTLAQQVVDAGVVPNPDQSFETKEIIFQGCTANGTVKDVFDALQANPVTAGIFRRSDWTHIGADLHHPLDGLPSTQQAGPNPNTPRTNYWVIVFVKIHQN